MYNKILIKVDSEAFIKARKKAGITQSDLSILTGLKQEYISYLETGKVKSIRKQTMNKIKKIIDI